MLTDNSEIDNAISQASPPPLAPKIDATSEYIDPLTFIQTPLSSHLLKISIGVDKNLVTDLLIHTTELFKNGRFDGFETNKTPTEYVEEAYHDEIFSQVKDYFLHHLVIDFLIKKIINYKINFVNYPRLSLIEYLPSKEIFYHFDVSIADTIELKEWKHFAFKSPKRKRYKDLDKQVSSFIEQYQNQSKKTNSDVIEEDDWILFETTLLDQHDNPLKKFNTGSFWIHLGPEEISEPFPHQFLEKQVNNTFITANFSSYTSRREYEECSYRILITVNAIIKGNIFSLDLLKSTFKLKNKADVHSKLMEIFSFRNDVSQRQSIVDEVFHLLLSKHRFEVPKHLVLRREEDIIAILTQQPDYHVYKSQIDFQLSVELLAEKQLKEEIIIDQIAYYENIEVNIKDIAYYLHLLCNKKLKDFIYFKPQLEHITTSCAPINSSTFSQAVLREKTLNFIIHTLTR